MALAKQNEYSMHEILAVVLCRICVLALGRVTHFGILRL